MGTKQIKLAFALREPLDKRISIMLLKIHSVTGARSEDTQPHLVSHKRGVSQVLLTQRPNLGHLATCSKDFTGRKARPGLLCIVTHATVCTTCSTIHEAAGESWHVPGAPGPALHHLHFVMMGKSLPFSGPPHLSQRAWLSDCGSCEAAKRPWAHSNVWT